MDILKYGADCDVVSPKALREKVAAELSRARMRYRT
ncbi:MAG: WYL domain-containing protein [Sulfuricaulis sp.]|nr:WYL domain-containing protein [Sulfuricaulis sp.]